ncbi:MAG: alpha/beta hydrolase fold [Streptomyces oryziradicis]|nr:alpha/beta hydrolase fold [Actinacidiphila oryziradicis]
MAALALRSSHAPGDAVRAESADSDQIDRPAAPGGSYIRFAVSRRRLFQAVLAAGMDKTRHPQLEQAAAALTATVFAPALVLSGGDRVAAKDLATAAGAVAPPTRVQRSPRLRTTHGHHLEVPGTPLEVVAQWIDWMARSSDMTTVRLNGIDFNYQRSGSGPRLLFLNGSGGTLAESAPLLAFLARHFDVAAFDQRGLGRTGLPDSPYAMADLAADAAALADHLGWERFRLLGVSFGGMVAQELAVTAPDRIERLALLCTSPGGAGGSSFPLHTLVDMAPADRAALYTRILDTRFTPEWLAGHDADRALTAGLVERSAPQKSDQVLNGEALQMAARSGHDVYERLPRVDCPTLVAAGRYDGIAPPENSAAIGKQIPYAELRLFDGGHLFFIQDPAAFPEIIRFLTAD